MNHDKSIIYSINNVRYLINNSILMLKDLDAILSKNGFQPLNGNALGTETSKNIHQTMHQRSTFFPQFIARQYAPTDALQSMKVTKILFVNIQFFHGDYEELPPSFISSVITFPYTIEKPKESIQNYWLKNTVYEINKWDDVLMNGQLNKNVDNSRKETTFWCRDLLSINGQEELEGEAHKLVKVFNDL